MAPAGYKLTGGLSAAGRTSADLMIEAADDVTWLVKVHVIAGGEGPTLLLTGALHGDEYEGPIALTRLARELAPSTLRGRVIIVPVVNTSAMAARSRCSPLDNLDLNRCFPGEADGSPSRRLAHAISQALLPEADIVIDCHSGGTAMTYIPCAMMHPLAEPAIRRRTLDLISAMQLPAAVVIDETDKPGMFDTLVESQGKLFVCCELGGGGVSPETVAIAEQGLRNALIHLRMIDGSPVTALWRGRREARLLEVPDLGFASAATVAGLFEPIRELGDIVRAGESLAMIHPEKGDGEPIPVVSPRDGMLFVRRATGRIEAGQRATLVARACSSAREE